MKNKLFKYGDSIIRILKATDNRFLIVDCIKKSMPRWIEKSDISNYTECTEADLLSITNTVLGDIESMDVISKRKMHKRYTLIAGVLPFVDNAKKRSEAISIIADDKKISKQTIRNYLYLYLVYQDIAALAPKSQTTEKELSHDEKNMRWALNKFFYTTDKNSLHTAYTMMLKAKYCDGCGSLFSEYPSFYQFRYFYRKHRKMQNYYISRDGLKNYQRNNRPLLGDGVQAFASSVGVGMLDSTICDIYLINDGGNLVGRPILTACVDAYSGLCCGYSLSWEGGVYSLKSLMSNVITNKVDWCKQFGIIINQADWNCSSLPATLVTDKGKEYASMTFEQIADLGVTIVNLPPYRPELKGVVEKFFDIVQSLYKPHLRGKGVIESDYQERGAHDYRKDACLTMASFEKILLHCIIYYNAKRVIENFPYTAEMLSKNIEPYSARIWNYAINQPGANLITTDIKTLMLTLLLQAFVLHGDTIFDQLSDEDEGSLPEQVVEDKEFQRIMQSLLDELPEEQRAALMLYYYDKLSVKQIASIQGASEGTVKSRLNYGRKAVKIQVDAYEKKSGTKLHGVLPLILFELFGNGKKGAPTAELPSSVTAAIEAFGSASAAPASTVLAAGSVATKGALAVKKIVIGAVAALVVAGGVAGGIFLATSGLLSKPAVSTEQAAGSSSVMVSDDAPSESEGGGEITPSVHSHPGRTWEFGDDTHYSICTDCGQQVGEEEAHVYDDEGNCTVCDCGYFSKGLVYEQIGKFTLQVAGIGSCTDETIVIPEIYKGCSVTLIKTEAFQGNTQIKKVVIPDQFESVDQHAFSGCTNLAEVEFLGSCQLLQRLSFENCTALKKVTFPVMPKIEVDVFSNSPSLEELIIPEGVETIGISAFYDCTALKKVSFPSTLRQIENMAFDGCSSLEALSLPEGLERIGEQAFFRCDALAELSLPGSVKSVDRAAFGLCASLREITFLEGIKSVEVSAFENCPAIEKVTLPSSFETIVGAFAQSDKLTAVHYTGTVAQWHELEKSMKEGRFVAHCTDGDVTCENLLHNFPESWSISQQGHMKKCACGVKSERIAHTLENGYCTECGWGTSCGHLEFMEMPDGYYVSWVGECTDSHIVIPESYEGKPVVGIASGAFVYCTTLHKITLPASVKIIGRQAFEGCENLESINLWDVDHIEGFAFRNCRALEKVEISANFVEDSVFEGCTGLREVVLIADNVYGNTFSGCTGLQRVVLSSKMSGLDLLTFSGCSALTEICYYGTVEQWNAMDKVEMEDDEFEQNLSWDYQTGDYTVCCFDGTAPKTVL